MQNGQKSPLLKLTKDEIIDSIRGKLMRYFGVEVSDASPHQLYQAVGATVRDQVMERRVVTRGVRKKENAKKLYYLSAEFLVGRALENNMLALGELKAFRDALRELNVDLDTIADVEPEPGLGNGGLGRLAACFMDSLATLKLPVMGCSIRYEYGLFKQKIVDGCQVEMPDNWLESGNLWEIKKPDEAVEVHFGGNINIEWLGEKAVVEHTNYKTVFAVPYDMPVVGYENTMVDMLRLWSARSPSTIDMHQFSVGQYARAMEEKELAEVISKVLYPEDTHWQGKELRLKQHYFFSSATVQYMIKDFELVYGPNWSMLPEKVAMHINDTHPGLAIPELMRILVDEKDVDWEEAERICRGIFAYTNHTVMPEALEKWPEDLVKSLLPRVYMILEEMNKRLCERLWKDFPGQWERIGGMAILSYGQVKMANLCISMSHAVNGVAQIHADIIKKQTFKDYYMIQPDKFLGITNGITHRRWLMEANPGLSDLLDQAIGTTWRKHPEKLESLMPYADDAAFREQFAKVKCENKQRFAKWLSGKYGIAVDPNSMFDTQSKRMHEYKRQLLNALHILMLYNRIINDQNHGVAPITFLFSGKASPGYMRAKLIIRFINAIAELVSQNPKTRDILRVVFVENYSVSTAEILIPATEVSEQLSTAGKEASGTGNMKFMMNGAVTIGTLDGANVEIAERVGQDNAYIFGLRVDEVEAYYMYQSYRSSEIYEKDGFVRHLMDQMINGTLLPNAPMAFQDLYHALLFGDNGGMADPYFVLKDMENYAGTHARLRRDYASGDAWWKKAIINTAQSGYFSTDRTIKEYNDLIWHLPTLKVD